MTVPLRFIATDSHISEYPVPVTFTVSVQPEPSGQNLTN